MYKSIAVGFAFFTIATVLGALWAAEAWGGYWSWDPKETWALIVWLNYAAWLHMRLMKGLRGTVSAWWALVGLAVTTFAFLGVNMFLSGPAQLRHPVSFTRAAPPIQGAHGPPVGNFCVFGVTLIGLQSGLCVAFVLRTARAVTIPIGETHADTSSRSRAINIRIPSEITRRRPFTKTAPSDAQLMGVALRVWIAAWAGRPRPWRQQATRACASVAALASTKSAVARCGDDGEAHRLQGREHLQQLLRVRHRTRAIRSQQCADACKTTPWTVRGRRGWSSKPGTAWHLEDLLKLSRAWRSASTACAASKAGPW